MNPQSSANIISVSELSAVEQAWEKLKREPPSLHAKLRWPAGKAEEGAERLLMSVSLQANCFEWTACRRQAGLPYGRIIFADREFSTHRLSWLLFVGEIPSGLWVLHRFAVGERHGRHKLSVGDVLEIRRFADPTTRVGSYANLARTFGVTPAVIWQVVNGGAWRHVANSTQQNPPA